MDDPEQEPSREDHGGKALLVFVVAILIALVSGRFGPPNPRADEITTLHRLGLHQAALDVQAAATTANE